MLAKATKWLEKCTILQFILKNLNLQSLGLFTAMPIFGKQKGGPHPALWIRNHPAPSYCHPIVWNFNPSFMMSLPEPPSGAGISAYPGWYYTAVQTCRPNNLIVLYLKYFQSCKNLDTKDGWKYMLCMTHLENSHDMICWLLIWRWSRNSGGIF